MAHGFLPTSHRMCLNLNVFRVGKLLPSSTTPYCLAIWASLVAQTVKDLPAMRETWVQSLGWEDPLEKGNATHSSILAWIIPWTVYFMGYISCMFHGVAKIRTQLSDFHFTSCHVACRILVPQRGIEPVPLQWKCGVLTAGLPQKSRDSFHIQPQYMAVSLCLFSVSHFYEFY